MTLSSGELWSPASWEKFKRYAAALRLPDGKPFIVEPHLDLIGRRAFESDLVELLVLLPKGNYKTTFFAALAVYHLLTCPNAQTFIGAADRIQADEMYRFAAHFVDANPGLARKALVRRSTKEIRSRRDQGFIRVLASDDSKTGGKRQGFNPTLALVDEIHAHENSNLYVDMRSGVFKRNGRIISITTAGADEEGVLGVIRRGFLDMGAQGGEVRSGLKLTKAGRLVKSKQGRLTVAHSPSGRSTMLEWACKSDDDLNDSRVVKLANPASGVTIASLDDAREAPGITPAQFARYRCNIWAQADDAVIEEAAWDARNTGATIPEDASVVLAVDYARKSDATAVAKLWRDGERVVVEAHVWALAPRKAGVPAPAAHELIEGERIIRQSLVREFIRAVPQEVEAVVYDPHLIDPEELSDDGFLMVEFPQTPARTVPASKDLYEAINGGTLEHDGDPVLRSHVLAAGSKQAGEGWRFSKAASKKHIDALIAVMMGLACLDDAMAPPSIEWIA